MKEQVALNCDGSKMSYQCFLAVSCVLCNQSLLRSSLPPAADWLDFEGEAVREALYWSMQTVTVGRPLV